MADEPEEPPKRKGRWRSKRSKGRASVGLGFFDVKAERRADKAASSAAEAFLAHRDPWDEVKPP